MAKNLLLALALGATFVSQSAFAAEAPTLYGIMKYHELGGISGMYSVKAEPGAEPMLLFADGDMLGNYGAVYTDDGKYRILTYVEWEGLEAWLLQTVDFPECTYNWIDNWSGLDLNVIDDSAATLTYDPTTNTIFCVSIDKPNYNNPTATTFALKTMNRDNAKKTYVAPLSKRLYTLSVDSKGQMYGVGSDGWLYRVDKYNGTLEPIGDTGFIPEDDQSAVIDYKTDIMYWYANNYEGAKLFRVDLATGTADRITQFEYDFLLTGIFIDQTLHSASAPAAVTDLSASFEGASLTGTINFTLPIVDVNGNELTGDVNYTVSGNGVELTKGTGKPGAEIQAPVAIEKDGTVHFIVNVESDGEAGGASGIDLWVGMDTPKGVTDLIVSIDGDTASATWTLPERGVHEGYVDHSQVSYEIMRGPEELIVEKAFVGNSFSETVIRDGVYPVLYMVTPVLGSLRGESVIGNTAISGTHFEAPVTLDFTDPFLSLVLDIDDANGDGCSWEWAVDHGDYMWCLWPLSDDRMRDDWMYTPAVRFEPGFYYTVKVTVRSQGRWNAEEGSYEDVFAGDLSASVESVEGSPAFNKEVLSKEVITNRNWYTRESEYFNVDSETFARIGLHLTGGQETRNIYNACVNSIEVTKVDEAGVAEVVNADFAVRVVEGGIEILNPSGKTVLVHALDGRLAAKTSATDATVQLPAGLYVASCGSQSLKLAVR